MMNVAQTGGKKLLMLSHVMLLCFYIIDKSLQSQIDNRILFVCERHYPEWKMPRRRLIIFILRYSPLQIFYHQFLKLRIICSKL